MDYQTRSWSVSDIVDIWATLAKADSDRDSYVFDMVNVGRQALGDLFLDVRDEFTAAYRKGDIELAEKKADELLGILGDMDRLLACHRSFRLEPWLKAARGFGSDDSSRAYYEHNARTLISVWGDSDHLTDYASRSLSGFVSSYYRKRWEMFFNEVLDCMKTERKFDQKAFDAVIYDFERQWPDVELPAPRTPEDVKALTGELIGKYCRRN